MSVAGIAIELGAVALVILYAQRLEQNGAVALGAQVFAARQSLTLLIGIAAVVLIALSIAAGLNYLSAMLMVTLRRRYEIFCSQRVLRLVASVSYTSWRSDPGTPLTEGFLMRLARRDARYVGRCMTSGLTTIVPLCTGALAIITLCMLHWPLTIALMVLTGLSLPLLGRINIHASRSSTVMEHAAAPASQQYRQVLDSICATSARHGPDDGALGSLQSSTAVQSFVGAYERRMRAPDRSNVVTKMLFAIGVFSIIVILGAQSIGAGGGWTILLFYFVAARYGLVAVQQIVSRIIAINRFYPQLRRYFEFVAAHDPATMTEMQTSKRPTEANLSQLTAVVSSTRPSRLNVFATISAVMDAQEQPTTARNWLIRADPPWLDGCTLRQGLGLERAIELAEMKVAVDDRQLWNHLLRNLPCGLDEPVTRKTWSAIDPTARFIMSATAGLLQDAECYIIDEQSLRSLEGELVASCLRRLSSRVVFIVHCRKTDNVGRYGEREVAVLANGSRAELMNLEAFEREASTHTRCKEAADSVDLDHIEL